MEPNSDEKFSSDFGRTIKIMQYIGSGYSGSVFSDVFVRIRTKNLAFQTSLFFFLRTVTNCSSWRMDTEQLISLVFEKRCLWDMKERNYHNRDVKKRLWQEISDEMGIASKKFLIIF